MSSASPVEDPTLATLVPAPSRRRNAVLVTIAILVPVAVGWLGVAARTSPWVTAAAITLLDDGRVAIAADVVTPRFPNARLDAVMPAPGTVVEHVWVLTDADPDPLDGDSLERTVAALESDGRANQPPLTLPGGQARLLVTLEITDCAALTEDAVAADGATGPALVVGTPFGGTTDVSVHWNGWSATDLSAAGCN